MGLLASLLKMKLIQNMNAYRKSLHETSAQLMSSITVPSLMFSLPTNSKSMELNIKFSFIIYQETKSLINTLLVIIHHYENIILCWFFYYFFYYFNFHNEYISMIVQMTYNYMQLQTYLVN